MDEAKNIETLAAPKTQRELFIELSVLKQAALQAQILVEDKMREMVEELGATFRHEGLCTEHADAVYLQIRQRMNKKLEREVPFFVPLQARPEPWKHIKRNKASVEPVAEGATETPVGESPLMDIQEPTTENVVAFDNNAGIHVTDTADDINLD